MHEDGIRPLYGEPSRLERIFILNKKEKERRVVHSEDGTSLRFGEASRNPKIFDFFDKFSKKDTPTNNGDGTGIRHWP